MKRLKTILFIAFALFLKAYGMGFSFDEFISDIQVNATPDAMVFQGRIEKSGIPLSDGVQGNDVSATRFNFYLLNNLAAQGNRACLCHSEDSIDFCRTKLKNFYDSSDNKPRCLWASPSVSTQVIGGLFSISVPAPWIVFGYPGDKYVELSINGISMRPVKKIGAVPYALVAKRLEDEAAIRVSSISLVQHGNIYLNDGCIYFKNGEQVSTLCSATTASAIDSIQGDSVTIHAQAGDILFNTSTSAQTQMKIDNSGHIYIGSMTVSAETAGDFSLAIASPGLSVSEIQSLSNGPIELKSPLKINSGNINDGAIIIGSEDISLKAPGGSGFLRLVSDGKIGINNENPQHLLDVSGTIHVSAPSSSSEGGIKAGSILIGGANGNNIINDSQDIYLQRGNIKSVVIGDGTPQGAKLSVQGGIITDSMTITNSAEFSSVTINATSINAGLNATSQNPVVLGTTTIEGSLTVEGNINITAGNPAYKTKPNTFTSSNTFSNEVTASSNVYIHKHLIVGEKKLGAAEERFLQVGDSLNKADIYIAGGSGANSVLHFYRGEDEKAKLLATDQSLSFIVDNNELAYIKANSFGVNGDFIINGSPNPAFYVHGGSVAINSFEIKPDAALYVNGELKAQSIRFPDGTIITSTKTIGNPTGISANGDVTINSNERILFKLGNQTKLKIEGGKVGIGIEDSGDIKASLHVKGDMLLGEGSANLSGSGDLALKGGIYAEGSIKTAEVYTGGLRRIDSSGNIENAAWQGSVIDISHGGTGASSYPGEGPLRTYGSGEAAYISTGTINLETETTGVLPISRGGTGKNSFSAGFLKSENGEISSVSSINLSSDAEGTLPISKGGTNQNLLGFSGPLRSYGSGEAAYISTGAINLEAETTGVLPINKGGTGASSFLDNSLIYKSSSSSALSSFTLDEGKILIGGLGGALANGVILGTENQVNVEISGSNITLSLPQNIHTSASPTFSGLKLGLRAGILKTDALGAVFSAESINLSDVSGLLPIDKGGTNKNLSGVFGPLRNYGTYISTGAINLETESETEGVLPISKGGTGANAFLDNSLIYKPSSSSALSSFTLDEGKILIGGPGGALANGSILGTEGQVIITTMSSEGGYEINLSLPQDINASASPTFSGLKLSGLRAGILKTDASGKVFSAESINLSDVSGLLPIDKGGTNKNLSGLSGPLRSYGEGGGDSDYISTGPVNLSAEANETTGVLPINKGGTGKNSFSDGFLKSQNGEISSVSSINLSSDSEGLLPISKGGTNQNLLGFSGPLKNYGTYISTGAINLETESETTGILPINKGGTGVDASAFADNSLVYKPASSSELASFALEDGKILIGNAGALANGSILGTEGINVEISGSNITLSLPQDISQTSFPTFSGLTLSGFSAEILKTDASGKIVSHSLSFSDFNEGTLSVERGGTGASSYPGEGPLRNYGSGDAAYISTGTINLETETTGVLPINKGGTGVDASAFSDNSLVYKPASSSALASFTLEDGKILIGGANSLASGIILGTENQVNVEISGSNITLSLPQDISQTSSPTFSGLTVSGSISAQAATISGEISVPSITALNSLRLVPISSPPSNPETGYLIFHGGKLKIYNNNQWQEI